MKNALWKYFFSDGALSELVSKHPTELSRCQQQTDNKPDPDSDTEKIF